MSPPCVATVDCRSSTRERVVVVVLSMWAALSRVSVTFSSTFCTSFLSVTPNALNSDRSGQRSSKTNITAASTPALVRFGPEQVRVRPSFSESTVSQTWNHPVSER